MKRSRQPDAAPPVGADNDEALDAAARGVAPTSDDAEGIAEGNEEIDVIADAAGISIPDPKALGGPDEIERRDAHRWELDPRSAEDAESRDR